MRDRNEQIEVRGLQPGRSVFRYVRRHANVALAARRSDRGGWDRTRRHRSGSDRRRQFERRTRNGTRYHNWGAYNVIPTKRMPADGLGELRPRDHYRGDHRHCRCYRSHPRPKSLTSFLFLLPSHSASACLNSEKIKSEEKSVDIRSENMLSVNIICVSGNNNFPD